MRLELMQNIGQRQEQRMKLAPRMIQYMEILQLPLVALQNRIEQELQENIALEEDDVRNDFEQTQTSDDSKGDDFETDDAASDDFDRIYEQFQDLVEAGQRPSGNRLDSESDLKHDAMQNMISRPRSLQEHLKEQFVFFDCPDIIHKFAIYIIEHLDNDGYLKEKTLDDLVRTFGQPISPRDAETALSFVQKLDPSGVGARDLKECLLIQLKTDHAHYDVLHTLISDYLEEIQQNHRPLVQRKTGYSLETINTAIEELRQFRFRPGAIFSEQQALQVIPDVVVERDDEGRYVARLTKEHIPNLRISQFYQKQLGEQTDRNTKEYIQRKIMSARWLIEAIEQRQNTLKRVAQSIIDHQQSFLEKSSSSIEPLKMQQIADRVGVHVTTVSRAVGDKWIQCSRGIFPIKKFFGGGTVNTNGETVSWDAVRQELTDLVENEDKSCPLSDDQLARKLSESGRPVSRRTITKYREKMGIPTKRQRKQY